MLKDKMFKELYIGRLECPKGKNLNKNLIKGHYPMFIKVLNCDCDC